MAGDSADKASHRWLNSLTGAALAALAGIAIAGCGGGGKTTVSPKPSASSGGTSGSTVTVKESEFKLDPSTVNVKRAGVVTFTAKNTGKVDHSLEVEGNGVEKKLPQSLAPGKSATLTVNLKPGTYDFYCPLDDHKGLGMKGTIKVTGGSSSSGSSGSPGGGSGSGGSGSTGGGY